MTLTALPLRNLLIGICSHSDTTPSTTGIRLPCSAYLTHSNCLRVETCEVVSCPCLYLKYCALSASDPLKLNMLTKDRFVSIIPGVTVSVKLYCIRPLNSCAYRTFVNFSKFSVCDWFGNNVKLVQLN